MEAGLLKVVASPDVGFILVGSDAIDKLDEDADVIGLSDATGAATVAVPSLSPEIASSSIFPYFSESSGVPKSMPAGGWMTFSG